MKLPVENKVLPKHTKFCTREMERIEEMTLRNAFSALEQKKKEAAKGVQLDYEHVSVKRKFLE